MSRGRRRRRFRGKIRSGFGAGMEAKIQAAVLAVALFKKRVSIERDAEGKFVGFLINFSEAELAKPKVMELCQKLSEIGGLVKCSGFPMGGGETGTGQTFASFNPNDSLASFPDIDGDLIYTVGPSGNTLPPVCSPDGEGNTGKALQGVADANGAAAQIAVNLDAATNGLEGILAIEYNFDLKMTNGGQFTLEPGQFPMFNQESFVEISASGGNWVVDIIDGITGEEVQLVTTKPATAYSRWRVRSEAGTLTIDVSDAAGANTESIVYTTEEADIFPVELSQLTFFTEAADGSSPGKVLIDNWDATVLDGLAV